MLRLIVTLSVLALLVFTLPSAAVSAASPTITALADCSGKPAVRPSTVVFTCADAGIVAQHIQWHRWGTQFAVGEGSLITNDCTPDCAAGHFHSTAVMVIVAGREGCPNGQIAYQRVAYVREIQGIPQVGPTLTWWYRDCSTSPMNDR